MKKALMIFIPILCVIVLIPALLLALLVRPVGLGFAESVTISRVYIDKDIQVTLTDPEDVAEFIALCESDVATYSLPACGFGAVALIFQGKGKTVAIYPALDACNTMRLGEADRYFYDIPMEDRQRLCEILAQYDIIFPCV